MSDIHTVMIQLPAGLSEDQASRFAEAFGEDVLSTSMLRRGDPFHGTWAIQWLFDTAPDRTVLDATLSPLAAAAGLDMPEIAVERLPDVNWLEHSYRQFPPFSIGPFYIHGSHCTDPAPAGQIALEIEAATAFGSGEHGTTAGCLLLLDRLKHAGVSPAAVLDMGCGSGILGIAAVKLWGCPVTAIDIDPESIRVTARHAGANGVAKHIDGRAGDGFATVGGRYDLIIANILPAPLKAMAPALMRHLAPGGYAVLSGLLLDQAEGVQDVYTALGAVCETRLDRGEWSALLLRRTG